VITRAVGTQNGVTPDCFQFEAQTGDLFLLCSDGLTREVSDGAIQELLATDQPLQEQSNRLVEAANKAGGRDNITCILVQALA
jgi:protein phosphatase